MGIEKETVGKEVKVIKQLLGWNPQDRNYSVSRLTTVQCLFVVVVDEMTRTLEKVLQKKFSKQMTWFCLEIIEGSGISVFPIEKGIEG